MRPTSWSRGSGASSSGTGGSQDLAARSGSSRARPTPQAGRRPTYLFVLGLISLSLGVLNLLPLLPLDGGHIAFSLIEGVRGRAVAREVYERVSAVGIALVAALCSCIGLSNDIQAGSWAAQSPGERQSRQSRIDLQWRSPSGRSRVGGVTIGGGAPVVVQSMTTARSRATSRRRSPRSPRSPRPAARSCAAPSRDSPTPRRCPRSCASRRCR